MQCPICECGADTNVARVLLNTVSETRRQLRCKGPKHHEFVSVERPQAFDLERLCIKRSGDGKVRYFDKSKLLKEVRVGVNGVLTEPEVQNVFNGVIAQLQQALTGLGEWAEPPEIDQLADPEENAPSFRLRKNELVVYIADWKLRDLVEGQLKEVHNRVAHVLYGAAIRGRRDRPGRDGWERGAPDILQWIYSEYPDLKESIPTPDPDARYAKTWKPIPPKTQPDVVVKSGRMIVDRSTSTGDEEEIFLQELTGRLVGFSLERFQEAIGKALLGHPRAKKLAIWISWWVLAGLTGQSRVTTGQLSVGVLDCLRQLDDLAYIRWAARMKSIPQVRGLKEEAIALIEKPSDHLVLISPLGVPLRETSPVPMPEKDPDA